MFDFLQIGFSLQGIQVSIGQFSIVLGFVVGAEAAEIRAERYMNI